MFDSDFTKIPNKIFRLGLGPQEIAAFAALLSFGGSNNRGIFPSHRALCKAAGASGSSMDRALAKLRDAGVITWDRGKKGIANSYYIMPCGTWKKQGGDTTGMSPKKGGVTSQGCQGDITEMSPVTSQRCTNQMQLNQTQEPEEKFSSVEETFWDTEKTKRNVKGILSQIAIKLPVDLKPSGC
jgi:hypothetical protein